MREADAPSTGEVASVLSVVCPPTGGVMFAPSVIPRNAQRAKSEGRAKGWGWSAAKGIIEAGARKPRPFLFLPLLTNFME